MKEIIAGFAVGLAMLGAVSMASREPVSAGGFADEAAVHAKVDARLHQVLTGLVLKRAALHGAGGDLASVRILGR